ncbi:MAG TPA: hypothetical protein PK074_02470 [Spirochaetales bacterium]|nr:hypothetical protein [Spirochaetales bacterium]HQK33564.1 hypothetical protein [Spirochaetales bacterium]HRV29796.1 hypothetical protein [Spirochaetia bacterium]
MSKLPSIITAHAHSVFFEIVPPQRGHQRKNEKQASALVQSY